MLKTLILPILTFPKTSLTSNNYTKFNNSTNIQKKIQKNDTYDIIQYTYPYKKKLLRNTSFNSYKITINNTINTNITHVEKHKIKTNEVVNIKRNKKNFFLKKIKNYLNIIGITVFALPPILCVLSYIISFILTICCL